MKRKLTILLILLVGMVTSHAINTVKVKNVLVSQGGKANIVVELANSESVTAFTMKLVLPQGVDYVSFSKNDSRFSDHELWDGSINSNKTFGCLSAQNSPIAGTNGTLLTITINADASLHEGTELTATMKDITLSTTSLSEITLEDVTFKIIVKAPGFIAGDANGDGVVDVTDIVSIANAILGRPSSSFDAAAADVNGDGSIDVTDIVVIANMILRGNGQDNAQMGGGDEDDEEDMLDPQ